VDFNHDLKVVKSNSLFSSTYTIKQGKGYAHGTYLTTVKKVGLMERSINVAKSWLGKMFDFEKKKQIRKKTVNDKKKTSSRETK
jgi:hypothetical protein